MLSSIIDCDVVDEVDVVVIVEDVAVVDVEFDVDKIEDEVDVVADGCKNIVEFSRTNLRVYEARDSCSTKKAY